MSKLLSMLLLVLSNQLLGQIVRVQDSLLKNPIENVAFYFNGYGATSNERGLVDVSFFNENDTLEISHISYINKKIAKKYIGDIVYLTQKTNILPSIILTETIKVPIPEKYPIFSIKPTGISKLESSMANLLFSKSSINIQESQSGGGSPNYRGMEANRLLLIVDGISLNNAIYRSGHLQSSATINPFFIKSIELLSGPASVAYGNGAMGGALIFNTLMPNQENQIRFFQQFESSSNTIITNFHANYSNDKVAHITAFGLKSAGNLKMGSYRSHEYEDWGKEATIDNTQLNTEYSQVDFMHKSAYKINTKNHLLFNTQYSTSSNIYRFDKMNDIRNSAPKYENWYYGPQARFLQSINYSHISNNFAFDNIKTTISFQDIVESRHTQIFGEALLNNRKENVKIYDINIDFNKEIYPLRLTYGAGIRKQKVSSKANLSNNTDIFYNTTRYPENGSSMKEFFTYSQINFPIYEKLDFLLGFRLNRSVVQAKFGSYNFQDLKNINLSLVKSALISFKHLENTIINIAYYGGFRNPNIDDLGKIFSKDDLNVIIPNENLKPEYANNLELSVNYAIKPLKVQVQFFNTQISNAITRGYGTLNGVDSMIYDGEMMRIQMNKNIESSTINGVNFSASFSTNSDFSISASCNYLKGITYEKKPLAHIPPFNAKISFNYTLKKQSFNIYLNYNSWKLAEEYDEAGVDNLIEATVDGNPSWYTLNLSHSYIINKNITIDFALKNVFNTHYKTFGSGISASGRNFILGLDTYF